jgi:hypothetical protein
MRINSPYITGSAIITGNLCVQGTIVGTITGVASTASYALNAETLDGLDSTQFTQTGSFNSYTSSASSSVGDLSGSIATTTSNLSSSIGSLSSSVATTTSGLAGRITTVEGNYATTGSNIFSGTQTITGSFNQLGDMCVTGNITSTGQIIAQTINVQQVTSSIVYSCGSNTFGCSLTNNQVFTGSILATGSLTLNGPMIGSSTACFGGNITTSGCIGIGTPTAATPLHIVTAGLPTIRLTLGSEARCHNINGVNLGRDLQVLPFRHFSVQTGNGIAEGQIVLNAYEDFIVGTGASYTPRLTILSGGTVAIGTTGITDSYTATGGGWQTVQFGKGGVLGAYRTDNESMTGFNTYTSAPEGTNKAIISNIGGTAIRYYEDRITFNTLSTSGTAQTQCERMRITSAGEVLIGTTGNNFGKLDVTVSPSSYTAALGLGFQTNSAEGNSVGISFKSKIALGGAIWENARIATITENITASIYGALAFYTMNATTLAERVRITSAGDLSLKGRSTTSNYDAVFYNDNNQLAINANNTNVGKTINFNVRNDQNAMTISSGGNVIINNSGTSAPLSGQLVNKQISDTTNPFRNGIVNMANANSKLLSIFFDGNNNKHIIGATYYTGTDGGAFSPLTLQTSDIDRLFITTGGNVIIGNTTPYGGLTVSDFTSNDGNDSISLFYRGTTGGHESLIKFYDFRGQVNASIGNNLQDDGSGTQKARLVFKTSNSGTPLERMRINSTGDIVYEGLTVRKTKTGSTIITFTITLNSSGSWTPGYATIRVAGSRSGLQRQYSAEYFLRLTYYQGSTSAAVYNIGGSTADAVVGVASALVGGNSQLTITITDQGSTDFLIADLDGSFFTGVISVN